MTAAAQDGFDPFDFDTEQFTRKRYLVTKAMLAGAPLFLAPKAVELAAYEHPDWDMDETDTWVGWERRDDR